MKVDNVLRYGTILTDDELFDRCDEMAAEVRIRLFSYESVIYYIKSLIKTCLDTAKLLTTKVLSFIVARMSESVFSLITIISIILKW